MEREKIQLRKRFHLKHRNRKFLPRVSIFRSNRFSYLQIFDDLKQTTIFSCSDKGEKGDRIARAVSLGEKAAKRFSKLGFKEAIYDRSWYRYHGIVKACFDQFQKVLAS